MKMQTQAGSLAMQADRSADTGETVLQPETNKIKKTTTAASTAASTRQTQRTSLQRPLRLPRRADKGKGRARQADNDDGGDDDDDIRFRLDEQGEQDLEYGSHYSVSLGVVD
jgi:methionyl-tRNA formyltransferase